MEKIKKILFITPTLQRTGSEIVLFNLINNLGIKHGVSLLSIEKGALYDSLNDNIQKSYLFKKNKNQSLLEKISRKLAFNLILPLKLLFYRKKIWYLNTVVIAYVLKYAKLFKVRCIVHTHELEHMVDLLSQKDKENLLRLPYLVIANSKESGAVFKKNNYNGHLEICHPFIVSKKYHFDKVKYDLTRNELGISENNFVWLMAGTIDGNKNPDLFINIANHYVRKNSLVKFIWVGDNTNNEAFKETCITKSKHLSNFMWIHESGEKYMDYLNACDGFVLTSQFESFSIVTLEALALGKPVIANNCLGVSEIINSDGIGMIIHEKNNVRQFSEKMDGVMNKEIIFDPWEAIKRSHEFDISFATERWLSILDHYTGE